VWRMLVVVGLVACVPGGAEEWAVAAYLDGRGDLAPDAALHANALLTGAAGIAVGVELLGDTPGIGARRLWQPRGEAREATGWQPASAGDVNSFLRWVASRAGGANLMVVFLGHGLASQSGPEARQSAARMLVGPCGGGLRGRELADALRAELPRSDGRRVVVVLEACYGAGMETVHELADAADYLIAAPGEIASPGLPWDRLAHTLATVELSEPTALMKWLRGGLSHLSGAAPEMPCSLTLFDLSKYTEARDALAFMCLASLRDEPSAIEALRWAKMGAGAGVLGPELVDAEQLTASLALRGRTPELRRAAQRLRQALRELVSGRAGRHETRHDSAGVTLFLPGGPGATSQGYERSSRLARETGWARVVAAYLRRTAEQASGLVSG